MNNLSYAGYISRCQWVSDIHLDHNPSFNWPIPTDASTTLLVVAGDLTNKRKRHVAIAWLTHMAQHYAAIAVVLGNHDYWAASIELEANKWQILVPDNVFILNRTSLHLETINYYVHGCTLWTDANRNDYHLQYQITAKNGYGQPVYSDVQLIRKQNYSSRLGYAGILGEHHKDREWILLVFEQADPEAKHILVTHYSPFVARGLPEYHRNSDDVFWWCCQDMEFVLDMPVKPKLWIHGHVHTQLDYEAGEVRVVCNPSGYGGESLSPTEVESLVL